MIFIGSAKIFLPGDQFLKLGFTILAIHGAAIRDMEWLAPGFRDYLAATKGFNATEADAHGSNK